MGLTTVPGAGVVRRQVVLAAIYNLLKKRLVEMNAPTSGKRTEQTTKKASKAQAVFSSEHSRGVILAFD